MARSSNKNSDVSRGDRYIVTLRNDPSLVATNAAKGTVGLFIPDNGSGDPIAFLKCDAGTTTNWKQITTVAFVLDHGTLAGLADDDHPQYLDETRHDALPNDNPHGVNFTQAVAADAGTDISAAEAETLTDGSNADALHEHDHGALAGLGDDDHPQYLDETRHDALPNDNPHGVSFTQAVAADAGTDISAAEAETLTDGSNADALHGHDHGNLTGLGDDDHPQYLTEARHDALPFDNPHNVSFTQAVAADAGTDISAAEAETLTDGSNADGLHIHGRVEEQLEFGSSGNYFQEVIGGVLLTRIPDSSQKIVYLANGDIDYVEFFKGAVQTVPNRIARVDVTYSGGNPATEVWKIYDTADGTTILRTITLTHTFTGDDLTSTVEVTT